MTLSSPIHTTCTNNTTTNHLDQPRSAEISSMSQTTSEIIPGSWRNDSKNSSHFFVLYASVVGWSKVIGMQTLMIQRVYTDAPCQPHYWSKILEHPNFYSFLLKVMQSNASLHPQIKTQYKKAIREIIKSLYRPDCILNFRLIKVATFGRYNG